MLILPGKWISAKTTNCYGVLWEDSVGVKLIVLGTERQPLLVANMLLNMLPFHWSCLPMSNIPNRTQYATSNESAGLSSPKGCGCSACRQTWGSFHFAAAESNRSAGPQAPVRLEILQDAVCTDRPQAWLVVALLLAPERRREVCVCCSHISI